MTSRTTRPPPPPPRSLPLSNHPPQSTPQSRACSSPTRSASPTTKSRNPIARPATTSSEALLVCPARPPAVPRSPRRTTTATTTGSKNGTNCLTCSNECCLVCCFVVSFLFCFGESPVIFCRRFWCVIHRGGACFFFLSCDKRNSVSMHWVSILGDPRRLPYSSDRKYNLEPSEANQYQIPLYAFIFRVNPHTVFTSSSSPW